MKYYKPNMKPRRYRKEIMDKMMDIIMQRIYKDKEKYKPYNIDIQITTKGDKVWLENTFTNKER